jgi:hypothetical protein
MLRFNLKRFNLKHLNQKRFNQKCLNLKRFNLMRFNLKRFNLRGDGFWAAVNVEFPVSGLQKKKIMVGHNLDAAVSRLCGASVGKK